MTEVLMIYAVVVYTFDLALFLFPLLSLPPYLSLSSVDDVGGNREGLSVACNKFEVSRACMLEISQPYLGKLSLFSRRGGQNLLGIRYTAGGIPYVLRAMPLT